MRSASFLLALLSLITVSSAAQDTCAALNLTCGTCIQAEGCRFCPADGTCSSAAEADTPFRCTNQDEFVVSGKSCDSNEIYRTRFDGNKESQAPFFSDPLYSANGWVYDMINILPVWREGLTGAGVRVRINDLGMNYEHAEFADRFDADASCDSFYGVEDPLTQRAYVHGTSVASIVGAESNNGICGVGVAPGVTLSACTVVSDSVSITDGKFLHEKMDMIDISQNSIAVNGCGVTSIYGKSRRLQQDGVCPFNASLKNDTAFPNPCKVCDFNIGLSNHFDFSDECQSSIRKHCGFEHFLSQDVQACREFIDVFADHERVCTYFHDSDLPAIPEAIENGVKNGRNGKGIIYVFASGNNAIEGSNSNGSPLVYSRHTIPVGAVGQDGNIAAYSVPGSSLLVAAPGGKIYDSNQIEMVGAGAGDSTECDAIGSGTSFAAPVVSGVIALMLEANPGLGYRDVQGILAATSRVPGHTNKNDVESGVSPINSSTNSVSSSDETTTNAAFFTHSYDYGFGIIDAHAAVTAAKDWSAFGDEISVMVSKVESTCLIDDDPENPVVSALEVFSEDVNIGDANTFQVEYVEVLLDLDHDSRGDLEILLTSPGGTISRLQSGNRNENRGKVPDWKLTTVRSWGESPLGEWTLTIRDVSEGRHVTCTENFWTPPPFVDGCAIVDAFPNGCRTVGLRSTEFRTLTDINGATADSACCACGGGVRENDGCENSPWVIDFGFSSCLLFQFMNQCQIPGFTDDILDTVLKEGELTARGACCTCGGGIRGNSRTQSRGRLIGWTLTAYGHVAPVTPAPVISPTDAPADSNPTDNSDAATIFLPLVWFGPFTTCVLYLLA